MMKTVPRRLLAVVTVIVWLPTVAVAEDPKAADARDAFNGESAQSSQDRADELALLVATAGRYRIKLDGGRVAELNREPAFRWNNSIAGTKDAALFLWMAEGRPVVACTILWRPELGMFHEFQSLGPGPLEAERAGEKTWEVSQPGIKLAPVAGAPQPESNAVKRLNQMKMIAGQFSAEVVKGLPAYPEGSVWQLRLLPKPIARYGGPEHAVRDGAVFAFCQDTDPEVLLILECRGAGQAAAWNFAMAPMTGWSATGRHKDSVVWSQQRLHPATDAKQPYFVVGPVAREKP
jgi:hypothetical protein